MDVRGRALIRCSRVCWYAGLPSTWGMRCLGVAPMLVENPPVTRSGLMFCVIIAVCAFALHYMDEKAFSGHVVVEK